MTTKSRFVTVSEEVFATYLDNAGYKWEYEQPIAGLASKPDFQIRHDGIELLCDVKQRDPCPMPEGGGNCDPVGRVRDLIHRGVKQLADFQGHLCALALYNHGDWQTSLEPFVIYGAMFGQPGIAMNFSPETGTIDPDSARSVFTKRGGKMIKHYEPLEFRESPQNISAVIAVEMHSPPNPVYEQAYRDEQRRQESELGRPLNLDEELAIVAKLTRTMRGRLSERPRVTVCVNPFARLPFPENLFNGDYDERWSIVDGTMMSVFAGAKRPTTEND